MRISDLETRVAALALAVAEIRSAIDRSAPVELLKLIEQIQTDIQLTRASLRSVHGKIAIQKRLEPGNSRAAADVDSTDEEFDAMMKLQRSYGGNGELL